MSKTAEAGLHPRRRSFSRVRQIRLLLDPLDKQIHGGCHRRADHRDHPCPHRFLEQPVEEVELSGEHRQKVHRDMGRHRRLHGTIFNVAVDLRKTSPTFGKYAAELLSASNGKLMYIPKGFAHGYLTLEPDTLMQWCTDADFFGPAARCLKRNDPDVSIQWPLGNHCPILSEKDENGSYLRDLSKL